MRLIASLLLFAAPAAWACPALSGHYSVPLPDGRKGEAWVKQDECSTITVRTLATAEDGETYESEYTETTDGILRRVSDPANYAEYLVNTYDEAGLTRMTISSGLTRKGVLVSVVTTSRIVPDEQGLEITVSMRDDSGALLREMKTRWAAIQ